MKEIEKNAKNILDHGTYQEFVDYYADKSLSDASLQRMEGIVNCIKRNLKKRGISERLNVADIGCGAGVMSMMWAKEGHRVYGLDVNAALLDIAKQRASQENLNIDFCLGSATELPWEKESMDVCIAPELLEHVADWETCLREFVRILKPSGVLFVSTTNKLCPIQEEFTLPLYSWYPSLLKHRFENLARTTRPEIAGYATYPAVNWFSFYQLRQEFLKMGMDSFDRFDIMDIEQKSTYQKYIIHAVISNSILRWLGHVASSGLSMLAIKKP
ncbi:class I SAM-dependent methyltransferase [Chromatium okenii]|jgi:2-polyprenyl-6-hydroxyphenyl methylase/3-demethylubiquinone-9 3-methyltransferase|uniref:class I SAM-dependent methyltransferase n=1 Tax=Chromatium okenii TaxID=61644 RepID=UPI0026EE56D1|nr:class I SAM-dependent methyltransferase [Chromatium okenii]MBV5309189.1 class I SAM-dependent methyltransferase [Chromatium okenii]